MAMVMAEEEEDPPGPGLGLNHLPLELLYDIFCRCPAKSLYRLRCVCSKWLSILTTDLEFISLYHRHHHLSPLLLFFTRRTAANELVAACHRFDNGLMRYNFAVDFSPDLKSVPSCHGAVCFVFDSEVLLVDPITARASKLQISPNFNYSCSAALGYSAINDEFKLINLYTYEKFDNYHYSKVKELMCEILNVPTRELGLDSSSQNWRFLGKCPADVLGRKSYVCVDGKIYWLVAEKNYNPDCVRILSFDLVMEDFGVVRFPRNYSDRSAECLGLLEMREKLCLTDRLPWETRMAIWELEEGGNHVWVNKYVIDLSVFDRQDLMILGHVPSITIGDGGLGEVVIKIGRKDSVVYDLEKGTFREVCKQDDHEHEHEHEHEHGHQGEEEMHNVVELGLLLNRKHLL